MLYNISHSQQWSELQRFLVPKLTQLRALCQTQSIQKPGTGEEGLSNCNSQQRCWWVACAWTGDQFCRCQHLTPPVSCAAAAESGLLFRPTPHAFKPWKRDFVVDWRHSRARDQVSRGTACCQASRVAKAQGTLTHSLTHSHPAPHRHAAVSLTPDADLCLSAPDRRRLQLLFLVKRFDEGAAAPSCEEWAEVVPGALPMWLMVKNYLLQYILLEATYLRSTCCITGKPHTGDGNGKCNSAAAAALLGCRCCWHHLPIASSVRAASTQHACMAVWVCEYGCMSLPACCSLQVSATPMMKRLQQHACHKQQAQPAARVQSLLLPHKPQQRRHRLQHPHQRQPCVPATRLAALPQLLLLLRQKPPGTQMSSCCTEGSSSSTRWLLGTSTSMHTTSSSNNSISIIIRRNTKP